MIIGEVVGTVVASQKTENFRGLPLRVVRKLTTEGARTDTYTVAVDVVGAGEGETVLVTSGSAARNTQATDQRPCDAVIMAIVDTWQVENTVKYVKDALDYSAL